MSIVSLELEMAQHSYGYGSWDAPFWFIGPEQGKRTADNGCRAEAWRKLNENGLCDCYCFHNAIGEPDWHKEKPRLQRTWRPLILLLKTFLGEESNKECLRRYQRTKWGRSDGETCVIELSGLAASSFKEQVDRKQFRPERVQLISKNIRVYKPRFVVMYGISEKSNWEEIVGYPLVPDVVTRLGSTMIAFAPHPNTRGRTDVDWKTLGEKLKLVGT